MELEECGKHRRSRMNNGGELAKAVQETAMLQTNHIANSSQRRFG